MFNGLSGKHTDKDECFLLKSLYDLVEDMLSYFNIEVKHFRSNPTECC